MSAKVISVKLPDNGGTVCLSLECEEEKHTYKISEGTYREIGSPLSGAVMDDEAFDTVCTEDSKRRALDKALTLLGYADNNRRTLTVKLRRAGFSSEAAGYAVERAVALGYINEERQLSRLIEKYVSVELIGPARLTPKLLSKGYDRALIEEALAKLCSEGTVDFEEARLRLMEKHRPKTELERKKLLYKYGYYND